MNDRPRSAGGVRLAPLRKLAPVRDAREDAADRVLSSAHFQDGAAVERLVALSCERRIHVAEQLASRIVGGVQREGLRVAVRDELSKLIEAMDAWTASKAPPAEDWTVLSWLVRLPQSLRENAACAESVHLSETDVEWLVRKGVASLSVLLQGEDAQRAHAVRRSISQDDMGPFLERLGCLREGCTPSRTNDWLGAFAAWRTAARSVADYLLALFLLTAECRSRATVDGWEHSDDNEWVHAPAPKLPDVHGPSASPCAVMNWTIRTAHDESQAAGVRRMAAESARVFDVLRDRIDEALFVLPKERDVVLRGVGIKNVSGKYALGRPVVFAPFTSTAMRSRGEDEARQSLSKEGTFFIVRSHSAARVDFVSFVPAEGERILPSFTRFSVLHKSSSAVLRKLHCAHDIVTLAEHGDDTYAEARTDAQAVDEHVRALRETRFVRIRYLEDAYVEGRIASLPPPCEATTPLTAHIDEWISGTGHTLLLGAGGSGKTSATLAAYCVLAAMERVVPVFVSLPTVKEVFARGALDRHLTQELQLSTSQLELLASTRTLVLLLDSLDEVSVSAWTDVRAGVTCLLSRNPLTARARVYMSCRDEFLRTHGIQPFEVFGLSGQYVHMQPLTSEDVVSLVSKQCARIELTPEGQAERQRLVLCLAERLRDVLSHPCVLAMACSVSDASLAALVEGAVGSVPPAAVYEAFISRVMDGDSKGIAGLQHAALRMLDRCEWQLTVADAAMAFAAAGVSGEVFRAAYLPRVQRGGDGDGADAGALSFSHKGIGEYLVARALWEDATNALATVARSFTLDAPCVLEFYADIATALPKQRDAVCENVLIPTVLKSKGAIDQRTIAAASNALALACAGGSLLHRHDLSGITVERANLEGARFPLAILRSATFKGCHLHNADFDYADVEGARFPLSVCEHVMPPIEHAGRVASVCFSRDGRLLATGAQDEAVRVVEASSGKELFVLEGHSKRVTAVTFHPDSAVIASGSADETVRLWDAINGKEVRVLEGHEGGVNGVAFSHDGTLLAVGANDRVRVYEASTGALVRALEGDYGSVLSVCFSPDGKFIATGANDNVVRVWEAATGTQLRAIEGHTHWVNSVCFSPNGKLLASCANDQSVRLWDAATGAEVRVLEGHSAGVVSVCFSPDCKLLASGSHDKTARLWSVETGEELRRLEGHSHFVNSVSISPNGRLLASGSFDKTVRVWNIALGRSGRVRDGHARDIMCVCFSADGRRLATGSADQTLRVWDAATGLELHLLEGHTRRVYSACFSPDGGLLASGSLDATVRLWDAWAGEEVRALEGHEGFVQCVCFSPDGVRVVSASNDRTLRVWDVATGETVLTLEGHAGGVCGVCYSHDGKLIASAALDQTLRVWDAATGVEVRVLEGHTGEAFCVCFSPDGAFLASGSSDSTVRVWETSTGATVHTLQGHTHWVNGVCFSPDGKLLASGSNDMTVRLWDVKTGAALPPLEGHSGIVQSVCFSPDSALLASASRDKTVRLWSVSALRSAFSKLSVADGAVTNGEATSSNGGVHGNGSENGGAETTQNGDAPASDSNGKGSSTNGADAASKYSLARAALVGIVGSKAMSGACCVGRPSLCDDTSLGLYASFGATPK